MKNDAKARERNISQRKSRMLCLDLAMGIVMLAMTQAEAFGDMAHRIGGIALCAMVTTHIWEHRSWFKTLNRGRWTCRRKTVAAIVILPGCLLITALVLGFFVPGTVSQLNGEAGLTPIGRSHHLLTVISVVAIAVHAVYLVPRRLKRPRR